MSSSTPPRSAALRFDVVAGLTAAAVVLPKAMAYATVAGLPVAVGLYTAFVPMVVYGLLGSSRVLSVSSTTTVAIVRPEGRLFFVNAQDVSDQINALVARHQPRVLALDMSRVPDLEYSALQMIVEGEKRASGRGITLWLVGLNPGALEMVRKAGLYERLGRERMLFNARAAIARYQALQAKR
jgi:MFS superfamily sulfate permease-like transporter